MPSRVPARPYRFNRWFCLIVVVAWNYLGFTSMASDKPPIAMLLLSPLAFAAALLIFSAGAFKLPFSALGPEPRTSLPDEQPVEYANAGGMIGWFNATAPFISWMVYERGIGFKAFGVGKGFVPFSQIRRVQKSLFWRCKVEHVSPEIRSPLRIPSKKIQLAIESGMGR